MCRHNSSAYLSKALILLLMLQQCPVQVLSGIGIVGIYLRCPPELINGTHNNAFANQRDTQIVISL